MGAGKESTGIVIISLVFAAMLLYGCTVPGIPSWVPFIGQPTTTPTPMQTPIINTTTPTPGQTPSGGCVCTLQYEPVCGTDNVTYSNPCFLACANATRDYAGECGPINPMTTPTPKPTVTTVPTPTSVPCPSNCLYGCNPGTATCKTPVCPVSCTNGCEVGTETCIQLPVLQMNNTNFESGTYSGWIASGGGWGSGPKNGPYANSIGNYYASPYSGFEGTYFASTAQTKLATGTLVSNKFTIQKKYLEFLVVGQDDEQLCIGFKLNDTTPDASCRDLKNNVKTIMYFQPKTDLVNPSSTFKRFSYDVSAYKDKYVVIEVIDGSVRSYIEVDDFRQSDDATGITNFSSGSSYYCNHNTICEQGLGEMDTTCSDDCKPTSYCKYVSGDTGTVDFTFLCYGYRLTEDGLFLYLQNTANKSVTLRGIKCTEETNYDFTKDLTQVNIAFPIGSFAKVSENMTCYDSKGNPRKWKAGEPFIGRLFVDYMEDSTKTEFKSRMNFATVAQQKA